MCSMQGLFAMEIMGFGWLLVSGLSLVPFPPAMMTAFIRPFSPRSIPDRIILPERTTHNRSGSLNAPYNPKLCQS